MLINLKSPSPVLVMIYSMYVFICNRFQAARANNSKITILGEYLSLTHGCAGLLELTGPGLKLLKSAFNAESFMCRLSGFTSSHFGVIRSQNVCRSPKARKIYENP